MYSKNPILVRIEIQAILMSIIGGHLQILPTTQLTMLRSWGNEHGIRTMKSSVNVVR